MESKQNQSPEKRDNIQYYDLFFSLFNSFIMGFLILIMQNNLIYAIIAYVFTIIMLIGIIFTFQRKNPFYIYFVYAFIICGSFYAIPGLFIIPFEKFKFGIIDYAIYIITIPELCYLAILFKNAGYAFEGMYRTRYDPNILYLLTDPEAQERFEQQRYEAKQQKIEQKKEYNKQYKRNIFLSLCVICLIGFFISIFLR
ncbi:MAG: hypothetical protein ACFFG0_51120 [Candidatus Thorarchaeota archaeon]